MILWLSFRVIENSFGNLNLGFYKSLADPSNIDLPYKLFLVFAVSLRGIKNR